MENQDHLMEVMGVENGGDKSTCAIIIFHLVDKSVTNYLRSMFDHFKVQMDILYEKRRQSLEQMHSYQLGISITEHIQNLLNSNPFEMEQPEYNTRGKHFQSVLSAGIQNNFHNCTQARSKRNLPKQKSTNPSFQSDQCNFDRLSENLIVQNKLYGKDFKVNQIDPP